MIERKRTTIGLTTLRHWPSNDDQDIRLEYSIKRRLNNVNGANGPISPTLQKQKG
ncbi:hypothetical protein NSMM_380077 [Nitrosomonas mobilis]|uniref:Uncharacterized protein n=1 Tax=Nitrosomonas mobilis TaxID=51642 RepID=A0A1G5SE36_9PROT|nr:hypothetical protein NSMM_380077 [Nitrosomonas mobilis]